jgi:hypothetical protein
LLGLLPLIYAVYQRSFFLILGGKLLAAFIFLQGTTIHPDEPYHQSRPLGLSFESCSDSLLGEHVRKPAIAIQYDIMPLAVIARSVEALSKFPTENEKPRRTECLYFFVVFTRAKRHEILFKILLECRGIGISKLK